jgi:hypothetical protein
VTALAPLTPHQRDTFDGYCRRAGGGTRPVRVDRCESAVLHLVEKGWLRYTDPLVGPRGGITCVVEVTDAAADRWLDQQRKRTSVTL